MKTELVMNMYVKVCMISHPCHSAKVDFQLHFFRFQNYEGHGGWVVGVGRTFPPDDPIGQGTELSGTDFFRCTGPVL